MIITALDLLFKYLITNNLEIGEGIQILGGLITLCRIQNYGMAFGIPIGHLLIVIIKISIQAIFVILFIRIQQVKINKLIKYSSTLIVFGWIGNHLDRIFFASGDSRYFQLDYINVGWLFQLCTNISSLITILGWILFLIAIVIKFSDLKILFQKQNHTTPTK
jgi:lipoprotein signal peptidase